MHIAHLAALDRLLARSAVRYLRQSSPSHSCHDLQACNQLLVSRPVALRPLQNSPGTLMRTGVHEPAGCWDTAEGLFNSIQLPKAMLPPSVLTLLLERLQVNV